MLLFVTIVNSQVTVFDNKILDKAVISRLKVSKDFFKMSSKLIYCNQPKFNLEQNLRIPLLDGKTIIAEYKSSSLLKVGSVSYVYKIRDDVEGLIVFTEYKDFLVGSIMLGTGERYYISQVTKTIFSFLEFDNKFFANEECMSESNAENNSEKNSENNSNKTLNNQSQESTLSYNVCTDSPCPNSVVDIMVFFSNQTIASLSGGEVEAVAGTSNQVVIGNQGFISSGITNLQFNLVYARALDYNEEGTSLSNEKYNIKNNVAIQALRNQYGADLVSLICTHGSGIGDQPKDPTNFSSDAAYSAISYGYLIGYYTLFHEMGHNLGIRHDWYQYQSDAADIADGHRPCSWHHGYPNQAAILAGVSGAEERRWRTILSYTSPFSSAGLGNGYRINRWSNPSLLYTGDPMGIEASASVTYPANEKFALERTGCKIAAFRTPTVYDTCPDPPTGVTSQSICSGGNFSDIIVTGTAINWYAGPTFGTPIAINSALVAGTYYASQTVNGCESARLAVTVTIGNCVFITGTISGNTSMCPGNSASLSLAFTGQGPWTGTLSDGSSFSSSVTPLIIVKSPTVSTTYTIASLSNETQTATPGRMVGSGLVTVKAVPQLSTITASAPTTLCQGGRVNLTASAQSSLYFLPINSNVSFIDISSIGLSVGTLSDESKHVISMPNFLYNKISYTSATVFNNGVLVFGTETGDMGYDNAGLPYGFVGLNNPAAICAMWDDLYPNSGTSIKTATLNNKFIIQWTNEYHYNYRTTSGTITFQIQLDLISGQIHLVYPDVMYENSWIDYGKSATIGLNINSTFSIQYSSLSASLINNKSITYSPHTISWSNGETTPTITVSDAGNYTATLTSKNGCSTSVTTSITINNSCFAPSGTISGYTTLCMGSSTQLNIAVTGQGPWSGTLSDGTVFSGSVSPIVVTVSPTVNTDYTIATLSNSTSPIDSSYLYGSAKVIVKSPPQKPIITCGDSTILCQGDTVNLSVSTQTHPYIDNTNSAVSFIDISSTGTSVGTLSDLTYNGYEISLSSIPNFKYNTIQYTTATVFNGGVLVFGSITGDEYLDIFGTNLSSGLLGIVNPAAICAFGADLTLGANSSIKTKMINNTFIIQWTNLFHYSYESNGTVTFQIQLDGLTGKIYLVYSDVNCEHSDINNGKSAAIGLSFSANSTLEYSIKNASVIDGQSIEYSPTLPNWSNGLTTPTITVSTAGNYDVTVTNGCGTATSPQTTVSLINCETGKFGVGTEEPNASLEINGSLSRKLTTITGSTLLTTDHSLILCNSESPITLTLPSAITCRGREYNIKNKALGTTSIVTTNGQSIDLLSSASLLINQSITLFSDGTNWKIIKKNN